MDGADVLTGYGNAQYDQHAKRVLADKKIMAYILKRTVPEFQDETLDDIAYRYIEGDPKVGEVPVNPDKTNAVRGSAARHAKNVQGDRNEAVSPTEGWITFDILFHAKAPRTGELITLIINVEAQKTQRRSRLGYDLLKRAMYYAGRLISSQKETEFAGSDYDGLKKVYSIFICMDSPDGRNAINRYQMLEEHLLHRYRADKASYDMLSVVMIYLGSDKTKDRVISLLQLLFRNTELSGRQKEERLEEEYHLRLTSDLREELSTMCNLSEGLVDMVTERVTKSVTKSVKQEMYVETVRNLMHNMGFSMDQAMDAAGVPEAVRFDIRKALAQ